MPEKDHPSFSTTTGAIEQGERIEAGRCGSSPTGFQSRRQQPWTNRSVLAVSILGRIAEASFLRNERV